jgi:hypothetical protein
MLQWLASELPWEGNLSNPVLVHQQKIKYMENIPELMNKCFHNTSAPGNVSQGVSKYKLLKCIYHHSTALMMFSYNTAKLMKYSTDED